MPLEHFNYSRTTRTKKLESHYLTKFQSFNFYGTQLDNVKEMKIIQNLIISNKNKDKEESNEAACSFKKDKLQKKR